MSAPVSVCRQNDGVGRSGLGRRDQEIGPTLPGLDRLTPVGMMGPGNSVQLITTRLDHFIWMNLCFSKEETTHLSGQPMDFRFLDFFSSDPFLGIFAKPF